MYRTPDAASYETGRPFAASLRRPSVFARGVGASVTLAVCLAVSASSAALAHAQEAPSPTAPATMERAVVVASGQGEVTLRPDRATVSVTIRTVAPEPEEASSRNLETTQAVTAAIEELDMELDSLRSTGVRIGPNREYTPDGPRDAGYFAQRSLSVTTNDLGDVGRVIQAAVGAGANQVDGVSYSSTEEESARREALTRAVEKARADAAVVARAAGGRLGAVVLLSTENVSVPRPLVRGFGVQAETQALAADQSLPDPEDLTVTAHVQGRWAFEPADR